MEKVVLLGACFCVYLFLFIKYIHVLYRILNKKRYIEFTYKSQISINENNKKALLLVTIVNIILIFSLMYSLIYSQLKLNSILVVLVIGNISMVRKKYASSK